MPYEFKMTRRVEFAETDMAGIMHFSNFFRFMESAEHAFFRSLGYSVHEAGEGLVLGWPRVQASCDYRAPLRFEEEVEIHLLVERVGNRSISYQCVFRKRAGDGGAGALVARGQLKVVCAGMKPGGGGMASCAIPDEMREAIQVAPPEVLAENRLAHGT